ncbi:MAG: hypothetical protein Q8O89_08120 [Nanoarchaeota archaeon]|nr:hypothetical protein [Nanoarchaeota archaeon]
MNDALTELKFEGYEEKTENLTYILVKVAGTDLTGSEELGNFGSLEKFINEKIGIKDIESVVIDFTNLTGMIDSPAVGSLAALYREKDIVIYGLEKTKGNLIQKCSKVPVVENKEQALQTLLYYGVIRNMAPPDNSAQ